MLINKKLHITHPHLLLEWDYERNKISPEQVSRGSHKRAWWICDKNSQHRWEAGIYSRAILETDCPVCSGRVACKDNNVSITHPHLLEEWDYEKNTLKPTDLLFGSGKKIWWICKNNREHKWVSSLNNRTNSAKQRNCPYCSNQKTNHTNCLAILFPFLLEEWDWEKNIVSPYEINPGTHKKTYWICKKNSSHRWSCEVKSRTGKEKTGCPMCPSIISKGHHEVIEFIQEIYEDKILINDRSIIQNPKTNLFLELDIFLPDKMIAIEYNGEYWHSLDKTKKRDRIKNKSCKEKGIIIYTIDEINWIHNREEIKDNLRNIIESHVINR